jgi:hypothetical protein
MHFRYPPNTRAVAPAALLSAFHRALIDWAKYTRFIFSFDGTAITEPITIRDSEYAIASLESESKSMLRK